MPFDLVKFVKSNDNKYTAVIMLDSPEFDLTEHIVQKILNRIGNGTVCASRDGINCAAVAIGPMVADKISNIPLKSKDHIHFSRVELYDEKIRVYKSALSNFTLTYIALNTSATFNAHVEFEKSYKS